MLPLGAGGFAEVGVALGRGGSGFGVRVGGLGVSVGLEGVGVAGMGVSVGATVGGALVGVAVGIKVGVGSTLVGVGVGVGGALQAIATTASPTSTSVIKILVLNLCSPFSEFFPKGKPQKHSNRRSVLAPAMSATLRLIQLFSDSSDYSTES
jgi:hypothetical protein